MSGHILYEFLLKIMRNSHLIVILSHAVRSIIFILSSPAFMGRGSLVASHFLWEHKKIVFLTTWGCASDFLMTLPKFKMAVCTHTLHNFFVGAKTEKSAIISILHFTFAFPTFHI